MSDETTVLWRGEVAGAAYRDQPGLTFAVLADEVRCEENGRERNYPASYRETAAVTAHLARQLSDLRAAALDYLNNDGSRNCYDAHEMLKAKARLAALLEAP